MGLSKGEPTTPWPGLDQRLKLGAETKPRRPAARSLPASTLASGIRLRRLVSCRGPASSSYLPKGRGCGYESRPSW